MMSDVVRRAQLLRRCETVKRALSTAREAPLVMRDAYINDGAFKGIEVVIERSWIAPRWAPIIDRAVGCVESALAQASWRVDQIDRVVLIGGSSLVPAFRDALAAVVGKHRMLALPLAGVAVAMGATMVSARHTGGVSVPVVPEITDDDIPIEIDHVAV
jgi:molecular chaperone DnaK (HSP70)